MRTDRSIWAAPLLRPAVAIASLALVLGIAEGSARVLSRLMPPPGDPDIPEKWRDLPVIPDLFAAARPNVRGTFKGVLFETNSAGFPGPERLPSKAPELFRIMTIGDSYVMGSGVVLEDTYAYLLESSFASHDLLHDRRIQVLNIGLSGLSTHWIIQRLISLGLDFDPDLVIYGYTLNDIESDSYQRSAEPRFTDRDFYGESRSHLVRHLAPRWNALRELVGSPVGSYRHELDQNYFRNPEAWGETLSELDLLANIAAEREICIVLFIHTDLTSLKFAHPFEPHYAAVANAGRKRGFHVVESLPYHRGRDALSLWVHARDPHPNPEGHRILFAALADGLRSLPKACWAHR